MKRPPGTAGRSRQNAIESVVKRSAVLERPAGSSAHRELMRRGQGSRAPVTDGPPRPRHEAPGVQEAEPWFRAEMLRRTTKGKSTGVDLGVVDSRIERS